MKIETIKTQDTPTKYYREVRKRVAVVGPNTLGRNRLLPLDNKCVNDIFTTHDRFREFLRSA